jgi:uncharacterized membrane protein YdjX (TVP38/TMEM64 family)
MWYKIAMPEDPRNKLVHRRLLLIPLLIAAGLALAAWQPLGLADLLHWGRQAYELPFLTAAVVLAMVLLFAFGLPGSLGLWLIAPFQPPLIATGLLLTGSVGGALGAYAVSRRLRGSWQPRGFARRVMALLARQGDLVTQTALRVLPGFPHSVVNFAGGVLLLPLAVFTISAVIGLTIKWAVYATAVHGVVDAVESGTAVQAATIAPLAVLSTLLLLGAWAKRRIGAS